MQVRNHALTQEPSGIAYRTANLERSKINEQARTCEVVFATETAVPTWRGKEILSCTPQAVRLDRLNNGGALLSEHDRTRQCGRVERAWIEGGKCRALVRFSKSPLGEQEFQDVLDGIRGLVSVGYVVHRYEVSEDDEIYTATSWEPLEVSLVSIPADVNAGVGRSAETQNSTVEIIHEPFMPNTQTNPKKGETNPAHAERARVSEILTMGTRFNCLTEAQEAIREGTTIDAFRAWMIENKVMSRAHGSNGPKPLLTAGSTGAGSYMVPERRSVGEMIVGSPDFSALLQGGRKLVSFEIPEVSGSRSFHARALTTAVYGGTVQHTGIVNFAQERLTIADLLAGGQTSAGTVRYPRENSFVPAAAPVAEGTLKPAQAFDLIPVDAPVRKMAATAKLTDEILQDSPAAQSYIETRLGFAVQKAEDSSILTGDGTGANMLGILNTGGLQTIAKGADDALTAIRKAIGRIDINTDFEATGIVLNPLDFQTIELIKDANGQFIVGMVNTVTENGEPARAKSLWGLPLAVSKSMPAGTALVGAFKTAAQLFRRTGLVIEMTNSDGTDFQYNLLTIRAELRAALAIYNAAAFCTVTGLNG